MEASPSNFCHNVVLVCLAVCVTYGGILAFQASMEKQENRCQMTYMYPNYFPIATDASPGMILNKTLLFDKEAGIEPGILAGKGEKGLKSINISKNYALYFYREGWRHTNVKEALHRLSGVPVLFIPGNGGSYRQVRSLAGESERLFNSGPLDAALYQKATPTPQESAYLDLVDQSKVEALVTGGGRASADGRDTRSATAQWKAAMSQNRSLEMEKSPNKLDWFMVEFAEELSALDAGIAIRQTEFVVTAIGKILALYQEVAAERKRQLKKFTHHRRLKKLKKLRDDVPEPGQSTSVLLLGHSMGGAIARAAAVHPRLKANSVKTIITLSSPHIAPALATQPALVHWLRGVNSAWKQGFQQPSSGGPPILSDMVIASIAGGTKDVQVRSGLSQLDSIVPPGFFVTAGTNSMPFAWLSTDHLCIMWCNQVVVQVVKAILKLVDSDTKQLLADPILRHSILAGHFRSALPQAFGWLPSSSPTLSQQHQKLARHGISENRELKSSINGDKFESDATQEDPLANGECHPSTSWIVEPQETDIFSEASMVTVTSLDGRRRWLNIQTWANKRRDHFVLVTSLEPCKGIRIHLWPNRVLHTRTVPVEVTTHLLPLPSSTQKTEKGEMRHQPGPTGILLLSPEVMKGFGFVTLSIAPLVGRSVAGGSSVAAMAVAQFYRGSDVTIPISNMWLLSTIFKLREVKLEEGHAMLLKMDLGVNLGVIPVQLQSNATQCGQMGDYKLDPQILTSRLSTANRPFHSCKIGCFPPMAILWDPHAGHEVVIPSLHSELLVTDTPPASWRKPVEWESSTSHVMLLLDPHCTYSLRVAVSLRHAALRFLITHASQIIAMASAFLFYSIYHQTRAWELAQPLPSLLSSFSCTLGLPTPLILQCLVPLAIYLTTGIFCNNTPDSFEAVAWEALISYGIGSVLVAILGIGTLGLLRILLAFSLSWPKSANGCRNIQTSGWIQKWTWIQVISFVCTLFIHPVLGLLILLPMEVVASVASLHRYKVHQNDGENLLPESWNTRLINGHNTNHGNNGIKKTETTEKEGDLELVEHLNVFRYRHGILLLHFFASSLLLPSFFAWIRRPAFTFTLPSLLDTSPVSLILVHSVLSFNMDWQSSPLPSPPSLLGGTLPLSVIYATAGVASFLSGIIMSPSLILYCTAAVGGTTAVLYMEDIRRDGSTREVWQLKEQHKHHQ